MNTQNYIENKCLENLKKVIDDNASQSFGQPNDVKDSVKLGVICARYLDYRGADIFQTFVTCLQYANFHDEAMQVLDIAEKAGLF